MWQKTSLRPVIAFALLLCLSLSSIASVQQKSREKEKKEKPSGTPILWRQPGDIGSRDLYWGPGGTAMKPDLRKVTFIKEEKGGYSKKYRVRDASGREWVAKIGKEAQSETSAVRLLWGTGYETEINYLEPIVQIAGKGSFKNVRFEARPEHVKRLDEWKWKKNPFVGTREFQGLKVMMALINNWDMKDSNNKILLVRNGKNELRYVISDLGATFGHASTMPILWRINRSRNNPTKYAKTRFVDKVQGDRVRFNYGGKNKGLFKNITASEARWVGGLLSRLSNKQLRDAFRAANYTPAQIDLLVKAVRRRTDELVNLPRDERIGRSR